jgi:uncharacterized protein
MALWLEEAEELVHHGRIKVPYTWWVGETGSRFFAALRDERRILGTRCPSCDMVFVPPRKTCGRCFNTEPEWREVGPGGVLDTFAIPRRNEIPLPVQGALAYGVIKLDGADTGLTHLLGEFDANNLRKGLRLTPVFAQNRQGAILDILYFRPESAEGRS